MSSEGPIYRWLLQRFEEGDPKNTEEARNLRGLFRDVDPKVRWEALRSYRMLIPSLAQGDPLIREEIGAIEQGLPALASKEKKEAAKILKELKKQGERRATFLLIP